MEGAKVSGPAPTLGQHNEYVLKEILGLEASEIEALVDAQVVY